MKRYLLRGVVILQLLLIVSLGRGLWETLQSRRRIEKLIEKKERLLEEQVELEKEVERVGSDYYVEKIAREKLHLTKPGEMIVIVGEGTIPEVLGTEDSEDKEMSIFAKWMVILFGKEE